MIKNITVDNGSISTIGGRDAKTVSHTPNKPKSPKWMQLEKLFKNYGNETIIDRWIEELLEIERVSHRR